MTKGALGSVCVAVWLGCFTAAAVQLPPDMMVDKYLLQAQMLREEKDHKGALEAMSRIVALQKEHDLTLPEAFPFQYAQTALAAGLVQAAIESVNRYLSATGREGKYYREALALLVKAESTPLPECEPWNTEAYFHVATVESVTACLGAGADPNARDDYKDTPLHNAARLNQDPAVIEVLLKAGADLEAQDSLQRTPLHKAATFNKNPAVIEVLLAAGADPMAQNDDKKTPLQEAGNNKNPAVRRVLLSAGQGGGLVGLATGNTGAAAGGGPCQIPGYPKPPGGVKNLGLPWCPASVGMQVRAFALQAAGAQCAISLGSSSTPEQIESARREIRAACARLDAWGEGNCQCPPGLGQ